MKTFLVVAVWFGLAWAMTHMAAQGLQSALLTSLQEPEVETLEAVAHPGAGFVANSGSRLVER